MQALMLQKTNPDGSITFVPAETVQSSDGSNMALVGAEIKPTSGTPKTYTMYPDDAALTSNAVDGDTKIWEVIAGCKEFFIEAIDGNAGEPLLVGFSTTANDGAAVSTVLNALDTAISTPDGVGHSNTFTVSLDSKVTSKKYDGTNTIKTIALRLGGTTGLISRRYNLLTVE